MRRPANHTPPSRGSGAVFAAPLLRALNAPPDVLPLARQVQIASDMAKGWIGSTEAYTFTPENGGTTVSTLIEGTRRFDISVRLAEEYRSGPSAIAAIPIRTPEGALVPFSAVTGRGARELWQAIWKIRNRQ